VAGLVWLFAVSPFAARELIILAAPPVGLFGVLFELHFGISSDAVGPKPIASTVLSAGSENIHCRR
jgi:hypothetical protein